MTASILAPGPWLAVIEITAGMLTYASRYTNYPNEIFLKNSA